MKQPHNLLSNTSKSKILYQLKLQTPIGQMIAISDNSHMYLLKFSDCCDMQTAIKKLCKTHNALLKEESCELLMLLKSELQQYFEGTLKNFTVPVWTTGTSFQKHAWMVLISIGYGETRSYSQQATGVKKPTAVRAVARANASNLIAIVIPCHRIIAKNGNISGYNGGTYRKEWLLNHEKKHI